MKCFDIDGFHPISLDSYFKLTFNDNSGEHRLELGNFAVCNLLPNDTYRDALSPHEINLRRRVDKSVFLRVYCRAKSPVAGISIKEHFEVNVCPVAVRLTYRFYHHLETFFFPHKSAGEPLDNPEFDPRGIGSKFLEVHIKIPVSSSHQRILLCFKRRKLALPIVFLIWHYWCFCMQC